MRDFFPAKVILFGEYTIINGSHGLAFPLQELCAQVRFYEAKTDEFADKSLEDFCAYLKSETELSKAIDVEKFGDDLANGLSVRSNIPYGYGIGSSGALCAAIYARYAYDFSFQQNYDEAKLSSLREMMALMENFYHGKSSGLDCLISLINRPVLIKGRQDFIVIEDMPALSSFGQFSLFDSGAARNTGNLVDGFLKKYNEDAAYTKQVDVLSEKTNDIIDAFLNKNNSLFARLFAELSAAQYDVFAKMIPENVSQQWKKGLDSGDSLMKLCGAGGGGYFLSFSTEAKAQDMHNHVKLSDYQARNVHAA
jgi:mevalonate kinase